MNRREFLKMSLALTIGGLAMNADAAEIFSAKRIDFHAHAILPSYVDALKKLKIDAAAEEGFPLPKWNVESHLQFMEEAGIDFTVLSMATPHISDKSAARAINEEFAALCRRFPKKFGVVATLPLPNVEGSIEEFNYATKKLGALGVKVASNSDGVYLGDERLDPIFSALNEKNSLVIIHPSPARQLPRAGVVTGKVMALFEYPADTTRAVLNMLANGTLEKFPRLRIIVPHCGSFLPYMKQRAGAMFQMLASMNLMPPTDFAASFGKLFFDTAGDPMPEQFDMLLKVASLDKIIFGTDYPYVPAQILLRKKKSFDEELSRRGWTEKIYVDNARLMVSEE
ncbi:MAG: amidohydrolase [Selenomonadaceae bacterium]|nr:amidohydrolase [Selenomonadaceae bacterium]